MTGMLSPEYNADCADSYFKQCFDVIANLGDGSFGVVSVVFLQLQICVKLVILLLKIKIIKCLIVL